jgi:hypothetical protein
VQQATYTLSENHEIVEHSAQIPLYFLRFSFMPFVVESAAGANSLWFGKRSFGENIGLIEI